MPVETQSRLITATQAALNNAWNEAHEMVQNIDHPLSNWLHAVLHKIEGDEWNSRYWYARTSGNQFTDYEDSTQELLAVLRALKSVELDP